MAGAASRDRCLKENAAVTPEDLRAFLAQRFARWQLPDAFVFVEELPHTSIGKLFKLKLREQYAKWQWTPATHNSAAE